MTMTISPGLGRLTACLLCAGLLGCAARPDEDDGANVTRAIGTATYGLQSVFQSAAVSQRQLRLEAAVLAGQPIDAPGAAGEFSPASARARVAVLVLINAYVTKLAAIADNDTPLQDVETMKTLDPMVASLPTQLSRLTDPTAAQYTAPVTAVLGWVGQDYTAAQRSQAATDALQSAAPAAKQLLDLLGTDLRTLRDNRLGGAADLMERERAYYNGNLRRLSLGDRAALVDAMQANAYGRAQAETQAPGELIDALRRMHEALVTFVSSAHTSADNQAVGDAMATFEETVEPLSQTLTGH